LVDHHTSAFPLSFRGDVDVLTLTLQDAPQHGSTEVAERGAVPASQDGGHEASVTRECQMAYGVHALVDAMEPLPLHPPIDLGQSQPQRLELNAPNHPMLAPRQLRDGTIRRVLPEFLVHMTKKSGNPPDSPPQCP
jgi:hypothetical protein